MHCISHLLETHGALYRTGEGGMTPAFIKYTHTKRSFPSPSDHLQPLLPALPLLSFTTTSATSMHTLANPTTPPTLLLPTCAGADTRVSTVADIEKAPVRSVHALIGRAWGQVECTW